MMTNAMSRCARRPNPSMLTDCRATISAGGVSFSLVSNSSSLANGTSLPGLASTRPIVPGERARSITHFR